jgi:HYDIN/CFA65/VesB family protein
MMRSTTGAASTVWRRTPRARRYVRLGRYSPAASIGALAMLAACSIENRPVGVDETGGGAGGSGASGGTTGAVAAALRVVPSTLDLGAVTQGFAAQARLRLQNAGSVQLGLPAVAWAAGSDPDLTLVQNQCFGAVAAGGQCEVRVQLLPSRAEELRGALEISSAPAATVTVPIVARGLIAGDLLLGLAAGSFEDFGGVHVGETAESTLSVTNAGLTASGPLSFLFNRPELAPAVGAEGGCVPDQTSLATGESCDLRVLFTPTERGPLEAVASVTSVGAGSMSLSLRGRGLVPGVLGVSATALDFGGVVPGDAASLNVTVENQGDDPLTLARVALEPADVGVFAITDSNCGEGIVLAAGATCRVQVAFRPVREGVPAVGSLLLQTVGGGQSQSVALQGRGLARGNLLIEPVTAGEEDFGPVVLGEKVDRLFRISNPSMQESGAISLQVNDGFELQPMTGAGACEPNVTALSNGEGCTVGVSFAPTTRGPIEGALTVDSQLAGAKSLTLKGTGVAPAVLATETGGTEGVLDFGRVTRGSSGQQTVTLRNLGDQPLPPPTLEVTGPVSDQATAFSYSSACAEALGPDQTCDVAVTFSPALAGPHSATLEIVSAPGGRASVLMVGEAREPGRLVLAAADTGGEDFGDVAVGGNLARSFTVTNPGGVASGPLTIRTDDSQFVVDLGACGQAAAGLAESESCAFAVSFTPTTNAQTEARLSVLSPAAGETGLAVKGRGRSPGLLAATTTERDLGRANIGELGGPANELTWTVNNTGDLPSGPLSVDNTNPSDFDVSADTCTGQRVPGGGSCTVTTVFAPDAAGNRSGDITVADSTAAQAVTLRVAGFGVRLAAPGEACLVSTDCAGGVCSDGVCCNVACDGTCQTCETGQCLEQRDQQPCGNGNGVCFGLDQCRQPAGEACTRDADCGGNLVCKDCRLGGRQCTPPDACCGGCASPFECVNGTCDCPIQTDGLQQLDCGGGVCAPNRSGACCPSSPPLGCNCDPADNLCKECLVASQCPPGATGTVASCPAQQCQYSCDAARGFRDCNGRCIGPSQCCNDGDCGGLCQQCNTTTNSCESFAPGAPGRCALGEVCNDALQCITLPGLGSACSGDCAQGTCFQSICCESACAEGGGCDSQGRCPVCFTNESVHPLSAGDCVSQNGTARYCVPAASVGDFTVRAQAACQACEGGPCSLKLCAGFDATMEATGFALTSEPRHVWVTNEGVCNGQLVVPGEAYFDPVGQVTFTY